MFKREAGRKTCENKKEDENEREGGKRVKLRKENFKRPRKRGKTENEN